MTKFIKEYSAISIEEIRKIRGYKYRVLSKGTTKIPTTSGIYVWRYWPSMSSLDKNHIMDAFFDLQEKFPKNKETLKNSRMNVTIEKTPFGSRDDRGVFGYAKNSKKEAVVMKVLEENEESRQVFAHTLEMLVSSCPPIYIGKARNLQDRLGQHFEGKTSLLSDITESNIPLDDIYISFIVDEKISVEENEELSPCIEEILQRITNPPLTKRYG